MHYLFNGFNIFPEALIAFFLGAAVFAAAMVFVLSKKNIKISSVFSGQGLGDVEQLKADLARYKQMIDNLTVNLITADKEGNINFINPASERTLRSIQSLLPISVDKIVGSSMNVFHKNPSHQLGIISDEKNLPHSATIKLADEYLELSIHPLYDQDSKYIGPMVSWAVVTETIELKRKTQENKDKLEQTVLGASSKTEDSTKVLKSNITAIASATEQLLSSISEISSRAKDAADKTDNTVHTTNNAKHNVELLQEQSNEIGEIIKVVNAIASQTNLLALNATIEAARAGDSGKGFAVVANEVKELANQTAGATREITSKIRAIQDGTNNVMGMISGTAESITDLNNLIVAIASSVEEQNAALEEIGSTMVIVSDNVGSVGDNVTEITDSVKSNLAEMAI